MNPAVLSQLVILVPRLLEAGIEVYLRIAKARLQAQNRDEMSWEEFVSLVASVSVRDVDDLILEGQLGTPTPPGS